MEPVETVETQCIEVDSPTHTYLAGYTMIVTHNTNKEIPFAMILKKYSKPEQEKVSIIIMNN